MVQFNLLPDVKLQYLKARRVKRLVSLISTVVGAASLALFLIALVTVNVIQKNSLNNLTSDVKTQSAKLKSVKNINKILTVQNQLNTLTSLHDQKVVASRLFTYIGKVTPAAVTISNLNVDFTANTMSISGEAPNLDAVNTYTDTLKATKYRTDTAGSTPVSAFSDIVLSSFGRDSKAATYTITLSFDSQIFDSTNNTVKLIVPSGTENNTTKLFQQQASN